MSQFVINVEPTDGGFDAGVQFDTESLETTEMDFLRAAGFALDALAGRYAKTCARINHTPHPAITYLLESQVQTVYV